MNIRGTSVRRFAVMATDTRQAMLSRSNGPVGNTQANIVAKLDTSNNMGVVVGR